MQGFDYKHTEGDSRLLYGMGGPLLVALAIICARLVAGAEWLVIPMMLTVVALTGVVLVGFSRMLKDEDEREEL